MTIERLMTTNERFDSIPAFGERSEGERPFRKACLLRTGKPSPPPNVSIWDPKSGFSNIRSEFRGDVNLGKLFLAQNWAFYQKTRGYIKMVNSGMLI